MSLRTLTPVPSLSEALPFTMSPAPVSPAPVSPTTAGTVTPRSSAPAPAPAVMPVPRPSAPGQSRDLLAGSARELLAAGACDDSETRYARAHLAALRAAAAVLAARARPRSRRSGRVRSAWVLLAEVAPELVEWAAFFAAGAGKRAAAEAGLRGVVTEREADDLVREVETFLALVARVLGVTHQPALGGEAGSGVPASPTSVSRAS